MHQHTPAKEHCIVDVSMFGCVLSMLSCDIAMLNLIDLLLSSQDVLLCFGFVSTLTILLLLGNIVTLFIPVPPCL